MADEITTALPDSKPNSLEMRVETNYAPTERKSVEMVTTEPTTPDLTLETEATPEPTTPPAPAVDDTANALARERFQEKLRADRAEAELKNLKPSFDAPTSAPDINDKSTWGKKYADKPNDLETFLQARDDWARSGAVSEYTAQQNQIAEGKRNEAIKAEVYRKEQLTIAKNPDYYQVINQVAPIIGSMPILKQYIAERELGTDVAYHLAKNPAMLQQLTTMTPFQAGEFLFSLETRLKAPAPVKLTNAPEPIKTVGSNEVSKPTLASLASKDINGYMAMRKKQDLAARRAH